MTCAVFVTAHFNKYSMFFKSVTEKKSLKDIYKAFLGKLCV